MDKINIIKSRPVMLCRDNVDTDQIIPARFLKATSRSGFGEALFADWRVDAHFCINTQKGTILVASANFGCGSSREHAAWALYDYGFRAVVAGSFADIFRTNALNNGLLPIVVSTEFLEFLQGNPQVEIEINLLNQTISAGKITAQFEIDQYKKSCLINGYDDIDYLAAMKPEIERYEAENHTIAG